MNIGFQDGFHLNYFANMGEPNLACRLHISITDPFDLFVAVGTYRL